MRSLIDKLSGNLEKLDTLTKLPDIPRLHALDNRGRSVGDGPVASLPLDEVMQAQEKIDGACVRLVLPPSSAWGNSGSPLCMRDCIVGTNDSFIYASGDLVQPVKNPVYNALVNSGLWEWMPQLRKRHTPMLTVIYGEVYGHNIQPKVNGNYLPEGSTANGFRIFDIAEFPDEALEKALSMSLEQIAGLRDSMREHCFLDNHGFRSRMMEFQYWAGLQSVPELPAVEVSKLRDMPASEGLAFLKSMLSRTAAPLAEGALLKPEGIVLKSGSRGHAVKMHFGTYERIGK